MNLARTVALAVIALVLAADFALEYIWPRVVLSEHRSEYRELAVEPDFQEAQEHIRQAVVMPS